MAFNPTKARAYIQPEEYATLADVIFIVEGTQLPAHSQVLAQHSSVLRGLFLEQEPSRQQPVRLEAPFKDHSVNTVACCLWFMYHPEKVADADFGSLGEGLPALLRLTNYLDYGVLLSTILQHLQANILPGATCEAALGWASVLEELKLSNPWAACVLRLAHLITRGDSAADAVGFRGFQLKGRLSPTGMAALVGAASARAATGTFPRADALACWLEGREPPTPHTFVWHVTGYSQLEEGIVSAPFEALGQTWRLELSPRGYGREEAVSLYIRVEGVTPRQRVPASMKFHLVSTRSEVASIAKEAFHSFTRKDDNFGFTHFVPFTTIRDPEAGFLVDDCLTLAVDISSHLY